MQTVVLHNLGPLLPASRTGYEPPLYTDIGFTTHDKVARKGATIQICIGDPTRPGNVISETSIMEVPSGRVFRLTEVVSWEDINAPSAAQGCGNYLWTSAYLGH